jgi:FAD/FMN-containing dehydrogenase
MDPMFEGLRQVLRGDLVTAHDPAYDTARRVWNGVIDRRPRGIVRCRGVADIIACVRFVAAENLPCSVRAGGHGVAGAAVCDGIVLDLSGMRSVWIDRSRLRARVEPGALWADLNLESQAFDLVTPGGIISSTGVAGLTLGGGIGWLMRKWGLSCDNLTSADLVTADGALVRTSEDENADLLWALRGAGTNFGVVTSLEFQLHPMGREVTAGMLVYTRGQGRQLFELYRDYVSSASEDLTTIVSLRTAPAVPYFPSELHGKPVVLVMVCCVGDDADKILHPLRAHIRPAADLVRRMPYLDFQRMFDPGVPSGLRYYWKSEYLKGIDDETIDTLLAHAWDAPSPRTYTLIYQMGGAVARRHGDSSAFEDRSAAFAMIINAAWEDGDATPHIEWTRALWERVRPASTGRTYINYLDRDEGQDRARAIYGAEKLHRLTALKQRYDPLNVFDASRLQLSPESQPTTPL